MGMFRTIAKRLATTAFLVILGACSDGSDHPAPLPEIPKTEAQLLRAQFGSLEEFFTEEGMQKILDFEGVSSPVTLMQLMSVTDREVFSAYESEVATVWESASAEAKFASDIVAQLIGERPFTDTRLIEFPNILMLLDAINTEAFTAAMNTLSSASTDHAWVLGIETMLPFEAGGNFSDSSLLDLNEEQAKTLVQANNSDTGTLGPNSQVIIDMIVSDKPDPFWMVNLIDLYDEANYPDGRASDLTGAEANAIYGQAILPMLIAYNSFPTLVMDVDIVLTQDDVEWEQAAMVRYASRDAFLRIFALNPDADDTVIHKEAGVENTLVNVSEMAESMKPEPQAGFLYNFRYCEVLLASPDGSQLRADVYNSLGLNLCPQEQWDRLDSEAIAQEFGATRALLNGPRFWVLDSIVSNSPPPEQPVIGLFGDIEMRLVASVLLPVDGLDANIGGDAAYRVAEVSRDTIFSYVAGRQVYELHDPDGNRYMMQSFSRANDQDLQLSELASLGARLELPEGWRFVTRTLAFAFDLRTVDGLAQVVTDNLSNTYQRVP
ncbi:MAG: hypothetical protein V7709_11520 [Halioglobus sp.]